MAFGKAVRSGILRSASILFLLKSSSESVSFPEVTCSARLSWRPNAYLTDPSKHLSSHLVRQRRTLSKIKLAVGNILKITGNLSFYFKAQPSTNRGKATTFSMYSHSLLPLQVAADRRENVFPCWNLTIHCSVPRKCVLAGNLRYAEVTRRHAEFVRQSWLKYVLWSVKYTLVSNLQQLMQGLFPALLQAHHVVKHSQISRINFQIQSSFRLCCANKCCYWFVFYRRD